MCSHLLHFAFVSLAWGDTYKKNINKANFKERILPMFSSRNLMVFSLTFKSWIHFELIFVYGVKNGLFSFFYIALSSYPNTTNWRNSFLHSYILYHKLIDHICVGLFLNFLFCPIIYVSAFMSVLYCLKKKKKTHTSWDKIESSVLYCFPEEGRGYPLQYSDLKKSMDYTVHGVTKSWTRLSDFQFHILFWLLWLCSMI